MKVARIRRDPQPRLTSPFGVGGTTPMPALDDLSDVDTTGVADGDTIVFDSGSSTWVPGGGGSGSGASSGARVYKSSNMSIPNGGGLTAITFDSERWDTDGFHSTVTDTSRFTIPTGMADKYTVGGTWYYDNGALSNGEYGDYIVRVNGTTLYALDRRTQSSSQIVAATFSTDLDLAEGDYVEFCARHSHASAVNVVSDAGVSPEVWIAKLGGVPHPTTSIWVPVMTEVDTDVWYVAVTGDGDAIMTEVPL